MSTFPSKLGRYQIVKHLANGGMAQVLLARATGIEGFERHVVVKRIHQNRAEDPVFVKMFLDEARLAAQLHHNNIVQVHDIGKEKGEYFFAMEYVHGEDLRKLLMKVNKKKEKVPFEHVVTIVTTAALALHHAHEQRGPDRKPLGLVHRDVSPANIIVGYDGNVKVVDFGIAKAALRAKGEDTKAGALKGKVSYMSPEQCAGQPVDRRGDVYSLGIVLFELSTVKRLFKGNNDFLTMSAIVQGQVPKPSSYRPDIPPELEGIILKALSVDPADRYQSADEMRDALEAFAAAKGLRTSTGALAGYMKQLFGQRPEPWLVDDATTELDLSVMTVDFDGNEAGAAAVPDSVELAAVPSLLEPTPSSPILRARKKAATDANALVKASTVAAATSRPSRPQLPPPNLASRKTPPPTPAPVSIPHATPRSPIPTVTAKPPESTKAKELEQAKQALANLTTEPEDDDNEDFNSTPNVPIQVVKPPVLPPAPPPASDKPPKDDGWTNGSPTTGSGTPLAWTADAPLPQAPSAAKTKLLAIGGLLVLGLGAAAFIVMRGGGEGADANATTPAKSPEVVQPPPPPPDPAPVDPAPVDPPPVDPKSVDPKSVDPKSVDPVAVDSVAVDPQPVDPQPVDPQPVDPQPVDVGAGSAKPADQGSAAAAGSATPVVKKKKKRTETKPREQWNPDELFLPEKK